MSTLQFWQNHCEFFAKLSQTPQQQREHAKFKRGLDKSLISFLRNANSDKHFEKKPKMCFGSLRQKPKMACFRNFKDRVQVFYTSNERDIGKILKNSREESLETLLGKPLDWKPVDSPVQMQLRPLLIEQKEPKKVAKPVSLKEYVQRIYRPPMSFLHRYFDGWRNGRHVAFLGRYLDALKNGYPIQLVEKCIKRLTK